MKRRNLNIKPPGLRNGLKKYRSKSVRITETHGQTTPPELGSGVITGIHKE